MPLKLVNKVANKLPNRFLEGGFRPMGHVIRQPRANTAEEIASSIRAYAQENPAIKDFEKSMSDLNPKHLGLAQDIIDLSRTQELLHTNINMNASKNGKPSIFEFLMKKFPIVSRQNPAAIELAETVVNHSDTQNAKYFLTRFFEHPIENRAELSQQMLAAKDAVPVLAEDTLSGGYLMDFSKNEEFFNFLTSLLNTEAKPENIRLFSKIMERVNSIETKATPTINIPTILSADSSRVAHNLEILPEVLKNSNKPFDVSAFLANNINLK